jgi:hypothetical protein
MELSDMIADPIPDDADEVVKKLVAFRNKLLVIEKRLAVSVEEFPENLAGLVEMEELIGAWSDEIYEWALLENIPL